MFLKLVLNSRTQATFHLTRYMPVYLAFEGFFRRQRFLFLVWGLLLFFFFFFGGCVWGFFVCVFFEFFFSWKIKTGQKIHDQNVFALDFSSEEAAILAAKAPRGQRGARSGAPAGDTV